ncbi:HupE/UreJ family protein [Cupriavidus sp. Marseille-Q8015]
MPTTAITRCRALALGATLSLTAATAFAHPGHEATTVLGSFWGGLLHPLTGADHLLAMASVGVWSALSTHGHAARFAPGAPRPGVAQLLRLPLAFVVLMLVGAALGMAGMALPAVEPMIATSLLVIGLLVALRAQLPAAAGMAIVGGFALFHGYAHGTELPASAPVMAYVGGFALATMTLHCLGLGAGLLLRRRASWLARAAGAGVALYGVGLLVA